MESQHSTRRSHRFIDLAGHTFGQWYVIGLHHVTEQGRTMWLCRCDCGKEKVVNGSHLRGGRSTKCDRCKSLRHGHHKSSEYAIWQGVLQRCLNPKCCIYHRYGGRGVTVCERWRAAFENFLADMGPRPSAEHSIDRIDNNGNYELGNCRWATTKEQHRNTRYNRLLTYCGRTMCLAEWAEEFGIRQDTLWSRLRRGWTFGRALTSIVQIRQR